ncbi:MAG: hypothetical protein Q9191_001704 [Dirinaria sp. TL-2023a]
MFQNEGSSLPLVIELSDEEDTVKKNQVRTPPLVIELSDDEDTTKNHKLHSQVGKHRIGLDEVPKNFGSSRGLKRPTSKESTTAPKLAVLNFDQEGRLEKVDAVSIKSEPTLGAALPVMMVDKNRTESIEYPRPNVQNGKPQSTLDNYPASTASTTTILDKYESGPTTSNMNSISTGEALNVESAITQPRNFVGTPQQLQSRNSSDEQAVSAIQGNILEETRRQKVNFDMVSDPAPAITTAEKIARGPLPSFHTISAESIRFNNGDFPREQRTTRNAQDATRSICLGKSSLRERSCLEGRDLVTQHLALTEVPKPPYRAPEAYMGPMPHQHPRHSGKPTSQEIMPTFKEAVAPTRTSRTSPDKVPVKLISTPSATAETRTETSLASEDRRAIDEGILSEMNRLLHGQKRILEAEEAERAMRAELIYRNRSQGLKHLDHHRTPRIQSPAPSSHSDLFIRSPTPPPAGLKRKRNQAEVIGFSKCSKPVSDSSQKRHQEPLKLDDFWGNTKRLASVTGSTKSNQNPLTLKDGYFDRHQERINALKARADREDRAYEQGCYDGQEVDLKLNEAGILNTTQTSTRPTTGGKGLSQETMQRWRMNQAAQVLPTPSTSDAEDERVDMPKLLYEYHVQRLVTLDGGREFDGCRTSFGPYYTIGEANTVAAQKVRQQDPENASVIFNSGGWSYNYEKDQTGTEQHTLQSAGGSIQTWVSRSIAPPNEGIGVPLKAFTTPAWLYVAMVSSSTSSIPLEGDSMTDLAAVDRRSRILPQDSSSASIIKACTLLDLANRAAGERWVEMQAADLPKDSVGDILRSEMEMNLRRELEDMDEENESFNRTCRDAGTGLEIHIWVDMVEVEGPRN